ncbi:MAG: hypothetical protein ACFFFC_15060 [Candidatus Thorarchaeota archaeon]
MRYSWKRVLLVIGMIIVVLLGTSIIGNLPVHRTNIVHIDPLGDVSDSNFDIVRICSYAERDNIVLELTVAGEIQTLESSSNPTFLYRIIVVARGLETNPHIYACTFDGEVIKQYGFDYEVENSTLRIFFPLTAFVHDSFMIGLEATTGSPYADQDLTLEDRNSPIARLLF